MQSDSVSCTDEGLSIDKQNAAIHFQVLRSAVYASLTRSFQFSFGIDQIKEDLTYINEYLVLFHQYNEALKQAFQKYSNEIHSLAPDMLEALECEFNRLFVGPDVLAAPPYGSVYTTASRVVFGRSTIAVREVYEASGLEPKNIGKDPDDHIVLMLEYLFVLQSRDLADMDKGRKVDISKRLEDQQKFINVHMLNWVPQFCEQIVSQSNAGYFVALGEFMREFLKSEASVLVEMAQALKIDDSTAVTSD